MILILSTAMVDSTTELVIDWIERLGGEWVRLNGQDLRGGRLRLDIDGDGADFVIDLDGAELRPADVGAVWFRRWLTPREWTADDFEPDPAFASAARDHVRGEIRALGDAVFSLFRGVPWLSDPDTATINKLRVLAAAAEVGLRVPRTRVANRRADLAAFVEEAGRAITKSLSEGAVFTGGDGQYGLYTAELTAASLEVAPDVVFPAFVQEHVEKAFEVRSFYLDGRFRSMAIFSQRDPTTAVDFRRYNQARPNRRVPYRLPVEVAGRARDLMTELGLTTGSLDFVVSREGEHVFLEVNPVGQFQMVSYPCNYRLERDVAAFLVAADAGRPDSARRCAAPSP